VADPLWINASGGAPAYSANEMRQAMALALMYDGRLLGGRQGVRPGGAQLQVSLGGSTISVQPGVACVDPGLSTPQGPYWVAIPATETATLTPADATNPRKDIVVARVYDNDEDSSGLRLARTEYIAGTPAASPSRPATPAGAMRLATIDVPASGGGSAVVTDERPFTVAPGGIVPVRAASDLAAAVAGRYRHRLDINMLEVDTGSAWVPVGYRGIIAWGQRTTASSTTTAADAGVLRLDNVALQNGRQYRIWTSPLHLDSTVVNDEIRARIRINTAGTALTTSGVLPGATVHSRQTDANVSEDKQISVTYTPGANQTVSLLLCVGRIAGTGSVSINNSDAEFTTQLVVEDIGAAVTGTGVVI
jgi:hypothetical protein